MRAKTRQDRRVGDTLLAQRPRTAIGGRGGSAARPGGVPASGVGFRGRSPSARCWPCGSPVADWRSTPRSSPSCSVTAVASLARMVATTSAVTLFSSVVLLCVLAYHFAPALSRRLSGIRLPVFPSATSRWVFEARPDLPTTVVRPDGAPPILEGPASVRDVLLQAERARSFLTGLLVGLGVLMVISLTALCNPHTDTAVAAAAAGRVQRGLPPVAWPLVRRPLAGHHLGRDGCAHRRRGGGAVCAGAVVAVVGVDRRGDPGACCRRQA